MVSKRPTTEPLKEVQFKAGTDSLFQTGFDFSDALDDDGVYSYRLTGLARSANAQQKGLKSSVMLLLQRLRRRMIKPISLSFLTSRTRPETGYYGWLPKEGLSNRCQTVSVCRPTFNEGAKNNTYSRNEKMIGYSFDHEFNDTFTVRQNLRFAQKKSRKRAYMATACAQIRSILQTLFESMC